FVELVLTKQLRDLDLCIAVVPKPLPRQVLDCTVTHKIIFKILAPDLLENFYQRLEERAVQNFSFDAEEAHDFPHHRSEVVDPSLLNDAVWLYLVVLTSAVRPRLDRKAAHP